MRQTKRFGHSRWALGHTLTTRGFSAGIEAQVMAILISTQDQMAFGTPWTDYSGGGALPMT